LKLLYNINSFTTAVFCRFEGKTYHIRCTRRTAVLFSESIFCYWKFEKSKILN